MNINNKSDALECCPRIGIFIDVQNMFYAAKLKNGSKIDYAKLLEIISDGRNIIVANAYMMCKAGVKMMNFESMLMKNGYDIYKKTMIFKRKNKDAAEVNIVSWEIGMVIDMIKWSSKLDTIILVSGNGAFVDALEYLKNFVRVEVAGLKMQTSINLRNVAQYFIEIGEGEGNCLIDGKFDEGEVLPVAAIEENVDPDSQLAFMDKIDKQRK
jgi:uncharacterized LabA/DUF88 family protein